MRQTLKIGISLVVAAALAMSGIALAQTSDDSTTTTTVAVEDTPAYTRIVDKLSPLVEDGTLTQAQADAVAELLAADLPLGPRGHRFEAILAVADFFDMTPRELRTALQDYDSLAAFAEANDSSADELISFLVDKVEAHLDEAVANGRITEDQKAEMLANATEHITDMVNGEIPDRPFLGGPGGPGFGGPGPGPDFNA